MSNITRRAERGEAIDFFYESMTIETNECLVWPYSKYQGYGRLCVNGKWYSVPRLTLLYHTSEPENTKLHATHRPVICHNRSCFNYNHLRWATHKQNMQDKILDKTNKGLKGEENTTSKLTEEQVLAIRADTRSHRIISLDYGVTKACIGFIKRRVTWGWL